MRECCVADARARLTRRARPTAARPVDSRRGANSQLEQLALTWARQCYKLNPGCYLKAYNAYKNRLAGGAKKILKVAVLKKTEVSEEVVRQQMSR